MATETGAADLLIELGCEELPPGELPQLTQAFFDNFCAGLEAAGLAFSAAESTYYYTPRRMALHLSRVAERQSDRRQERRGPSVAAAFDDSGAPTPAAEGFARSVGVEVSELGRVRNDKGEWLHHVVEVPGQPLDALLYPILQKSLDDLPVPRPMRWSDHDFSFVRPVHWLLVLHGGRVPAGELYGRAAGNATRGHRIHAPGPHTVPHPGEYLGVLEQAFVQADHRARRDRIRRLAEEAGREAGGETRITGTVLDDVCNLVEWPVAVRCRFDDAFLDVPQEALVASMESHQRFFPVMVGSGAQLTPAFVVIANLVSEDVDVVRDGFERVVRPRLADARFFWDQDRKTPLPQHQEALADVLFQEKLGTIGDKSKRIAELSSIFAEDMNIDPAPAERAALLAKCDLVTLMVGEFPELQGTMGAHYAAACGEPGAVATAIGSHYRPRFSGDAIPADPAGCAVSLADRMDTLVGIFAAGLKPTGNRDPFALRRSALGVIRILLEGGYPLTLSRMIGAAANQLSTVIEVPPGVLGEVHEFMLDRLRHYLTEQGASTRQVRSVLAAPLRDLPDLEARLRAVVDFMARDESASLIAANKRIGNILKKSEDEVATEISEDLLFFVQEKALFKEVGKISKKIEPLFNSGDYVTALRHLARLKPTVDDYFDHVMVMDEDLQIRANRLAQLTYLKALFDRVADFSEAD